MAGALFQGLALLSVDCVYHHTYSVPGAGAGGVVRANAPPKTYESSFIHHDFVQYRKQHS